jgi:protein involved in polysaccharide export with SLBB domain
MLFLAFFGIFAQSVIPDDIRRQFQNDRNAQEQLNRYMANTANDVNASGQVNRLLTNPAVRDSLFMRSELSKDTADVLSAEFLKATAKDTVFREISVYESMFKGKDIIPDSLIGSLQMFGYDVFSQDRVHSFSPGDMGNVPVDYPVKAGDEVRVHLWGRINEEHLLKVSREGKVNVPRVGPVTVAGMPFGTMQRNVSQKLQNIEGVNVSLSMGELRPIGIYIVGEVNSPGFHTVSPLTNVTNALFAAGGITSRGSLRQVQLKRNGKLMAEVDFYEFLISGKDNSGLRLQSGDVIVVPIARQMVAVVGNVRRSAFYELKKPTKLSEVLETAGGVSPAGYMNRIQVERFHGNSRQIVLDIDSSRVALPDVIIQDGDLIKVFPVLSKGKNAVFLSGNVLRPGKYEHKSGMRIRDVITDHLDLLPESHFEYAVVLRKTFPAFIERIVPFSLQKALENPGSDDDLLLEEQDEIIIYPLDYFTPERTISIDGSVTTPGIYKILENMTIRDLVLQSGGLSDDASKQRGELYRRQGDGAGFFEKTEFNVEKIMQADPEHNKLLNKDDRIFIRSMKGWEPERRVTLMGEIVYPGTYVIFEYETLGDLIERAGGFKPGAYLQASVFIRRSIRVLEQNKQAQYATELEANMVKLAIEMASKGLNTNSLFEQQMRLKEMLDSSTVMGRVLIDMTNESHYRAFTLEDGDELIIPKMPNTVSVLGEVYNPATFRRDDKRTTVRHYLNLAGGPKETAAKKEIYIVRANGTVISNKEVRIASVALEPGDAVVVPTKVRYSNNLKLFMDTADGVLKITSFFATLVTLIIAVNTMNKDK